jgi:hypothetical protein
VTELVAAPPSPDGNGVPPKAVTNDAGSPQRETRRKLEYAAIALAGLAVIVSSVTAWFSGWQAWIARDAAERQLRAYVFLGSTLAVDFQNDPHGSSVFTVNPSLKVLGITPAGWVSPAWDLKIFPAWSPPGQFPELPITAGRSDLVAIPAQDYSIGPKTVTLKNTDIDALKSQATMIVAFGRMTYTDVFDKTRWSDFCMFFSWNDVNNNKGQFCPKHNDYDWSGHPPPLVVTTVLQIGVSPQQPSKKLP